MNGKNLVQTSQILASYSVNLAKIIIRVQTNGSAVSERKLLVATRHPSSFHRPGDRHREVPPTNRNIRHFTRSSVATINIRQQCTADPAWDIYLGERLEKANCIRATWGPSPVCSNGIPLWDQPTSVFYVGLCYRSVTCDTQGWESKDLVWNLQAPQRVLHNSIVIMTLVCVLLCP